MFTVDYIPQACKPQTVPAKGDEPERVTEPLFSGHVKMKVPDYDERTELRDRVAASNKALIEVAKRIASNEVTKEQAVDEIMAKHGGSALSATRTIVKLLPDYVVEVHIVRLRDGYKYKSVAELLHDSGCHKLVEELAGAVFNKVEIGENGPELKQS